MRYQGRSTPDRKQKGSKTGAYLESLKKSKDWQSTLEWHGQGREGGAEEPRGTMWKAGTRAHIKACRPVR